MATDSTLTRNADHKGETAIAILGGRPLTRNTGIPLDLNWIRDVRVNTSAVERRAQTQTARRTVKKEWQAAWLLRAYPQAIRKLLSAFHGRPFELIAL